jgi:hypothetical protein
MAVCTACGHVGSAFDRFCQVCGKELSLDPVQDDQWPLSSSSDNGHAAPEATASEAAATPSSAPSATAVTQARLVVRSIAEGGQGDDRNEEEFILDGRDVAIGRAPSCDIVLHGDQLASRRHALLRNKGRHYTAVDLGSSNGTYLNDLEIREEVVLHDGDCLKVGSHEVIYSTAPASPNASLAGVRMSGPLPPAPLPETNPSMESVQISPYPPASAPAPEPPFILVSSTPLAPTEDAAPPQPLPESSLPVGQGHDDENANARMGVVDEVELSAEERPSSNLDQLRAQLNEVGAVLSQVADASAALARKADDEARAADQLRASLAGMRDSVVTILMEPPSAANQPDPALEALIGVARQTAENPRHLDYVTTLAAHASEIADALEAARFATDAARMRAALETLRTELDDVLK